MFDFELKSDPEYPRIGDTMTITATAPDGYDMVLDAVSWTLYEDDGQGNVLPVSFAIDGLTATGPARGDLSYLYVHATITHDGVVYDAARYFDPQVGSIQPTPDIALRLPTAGALT